MMSWFRRIVPVLLRMACLTAFWMGAYGMLSAQDFITVSGTITNKKDGKVIGEPLMRVYGYSSYELARDALKRWEQYVQKGKKDEAFDPGFCVESYVDVTTGQYDPMSLPRNGALLFCYPSADVSAVIKRVQGRTEINHSFDLSILLEATYVSVKTVRPVPKKPTVVGNTLNCGLVYPFKEPRLGKSTARFAVQTYVLDLNPQRQKDTIEYHYPIVLDGEEYHLTQLRRKGFDFTRDPLIVFADSTRRYRESLGQGGFLSDTTSLISWDDAYVMDSPEQRVLIDCSLWFEDYNRVYFRDTVRLADSRRVSRPMRFLDYDVRTFSLDPEAPQYKRLPTKQRMDEAQDLALEFQVGKATLDLRDSATVAQLDSLLETFRLIHTTEGQTLHEYRVSGTASPEGAYQKNVALARQRLDYILSHLRTVIPGSKAQSYVSSKVASWDDMADVLDSMNHIVEAASIRKIIRRFPRNPDAQGAQILHLPTYQTVIKPLLGRLRSVKVEYKYDIFRELTPDEILAKYRYDPDFHSGKKEFAIYEFWTLFQLIEQGRIPDVKDQEVIYRRAVKRARNADKNWQLPDNLLVQFLISQGKVDTTLLARHIDENYYLKRADGTVLWCDRKFDNYYINPSPIVANQVVMMLKAGYYERAAELVVMLPRETNEDYNRLYYITRCLAGFWQDDKEDADEIYRVICSTSKRNACVMDLALGRFSSVEADLEEMPQEDPLTDYLRAQYICQKYYQKNYQSWNTIPSETDQQEALFSLTRCFRKDPKYIAIADTDFDIFEDLAKVALEKSKEPEKEEILVPPGLTYDETVDLYYDERYRSYEYKDGKFINVDTGEVYEPKK